MNHNEEKEYYLNLLSNALDERRELTVMINEFRERLNELNRLEKMGLDEIKTRGYVELFQAKQAQAKELPKPTVDTVTELKLEVKQPPAKKVRKGTYEKHGLHGDKGANMIAYVLKEADKPLHLNDILAEIKRVYGVDLPYKQLSSMLQVIKKKGTAPIIKTGRGVYTYNK